MTAHASSMKATIAGIFLVAAAALGASASTLVAEASEGPERMVYVNDDGGEPASFENPSPSDSPDPADEFEMIDTLQEPEWTEAEIQRDLDAAGPDVEEGQAHSEPGPQDDSTVYAQGAPKAAEDCEWKERA